MAGFRFPLLLSTFLTFLSQNPNCIAVGGNQTNTTTAEVALTNATNLLEEWHKFRHSIGPSRKLDPSKYLKEGSNCTETFNETFAILLYDRLEVSQAYFPHKDFKTRSHVAHHLSFYKDKMQAPKKNLTDFCKSTIPQDFHRYTLDTVTGFSIPFRPFHVVCSAAMKCTHCMNIKQATEPDLHKACHDYELKRPDAQFPEAYPLHFAIKQWFRQARSRKCRPQLHNHEDTCTASLEQSIVLLNLWTRMSKKTGEDPSVYEEYEKEWKVVQELATNPQVLADVKNNFTLVENWKDIQWCKPRGGKDIHGLVCWHEKCERCRDLEKKVNDPIVHKICTIQASEPYEDQDVDVPSESSRKQSSTLWGMICVAILSVFLSNLP